MRNILIFICLLALGYFFFPREEGSNNHGITKGVIATVLEDPILEGEFPEQFDLPSYPSARPLYSLDMGLQTFLEKTLDQYRPDYGSIVVMDAETGAILALNSFTREDSDIQNIALRSSFPAASIFKLVTAAAAIDRGKANPDTVIEFNGANHTLYRRNVAEVKQNRWTRRMTLKEAFAKSVNTVFGKVGAFMITPAELESYARRFQFNQVVNADLPIQPGTFILNPEDTFAIAEAASGYSRLALMSPVQGAMMAGSVVNDGVMMEPYIVSQIQDSKGQPIYQAVPKPAVVVMSQKAAGDLRSMMNETISLGTARKSYRDFFRRNKRLVLDIGGKTGSLSGEHPRGKYDWYVGYATDGERRLSLAALTINKEVWRVKSAYLARLATERFFKNANQLNILPLRNATD